MDPSVLSRKQLPELKSMAADLQMRGYQRLRKADLIEAIVKEANAQADPNQSSVVANGQDRSTSDRPAPAEGAEARAGTDDGNSRTRTRTSERPAEQRPPDAADASGDGAESKAPSPRDRDDRGDQRDGGEQRDRDDRGEQRDGDDDGGRKRRRSRRERRRNRGDRDQGPSAGGGRPQQGGRQQRQEDDGVFNEPGEVRAGVLDVLPEGYGFLRTTGYLPGDKDVYVSQSTIRRTGLRRGDVVEGPIRQQKSGDKVPALQQVQKVNGVELDGSGTLGHRPEFKDMTPLFPDERLRLETPNGPISMRIIDLMSPIGKGQRGLVVSPPKAGKTTILKELGQAIANNNPECHLMVVLVDERPEEVTDMRRSVPGGIVASTFDRPADDHTQIAELAMERAKRLVENGEDVVVLLDSITRLARAYNLSAPASGRIMSGGVDSTALYPPKRFFGAARNIEGGGSLTIIATALIETGSKMDEVIFEEFKGTGNMELRLDRRMEQKRIFPAIDIDASGTRKEELLLDKEELTIIWKLRRVLAALEGPASLELLIDKMRSTRSNNQFLLQIQKSNLQT